MAIIKFGVEEAFFQLGAAKAVPVPIGSPVSQVRSSSTSSETVSANRSGVWECTPGRWQRQVRQAEFCFFLEGDCTFEPETGDPIHITAGEAVYFPADSFGVWDVRETSRKVFIVFNETAAA